MERCYVCASPLTSEAAACASCHTETRLLRLLEKKCSENRFLFGRVPISNAARPPRPTLPEGPPARPKVRRKKAPAPTTFDAPLFRDFQDEPKSIDQADVVLERNEPLHKPAPSKLYYKTASYLIDVVLCALLNLIVLRLVLAFSSRDIMNLATFSLIPLLFVFLSFTILYFWLFTGLIHKSLGGVIAEKIQQKRTAP